MSKLWADIQAREIMKAEPEYWDDYFDSLDYAGRIPAVELRTVVDIDLPPYQTAIVSDAVRWEVWDRDNFTCQHCGSRRFLSVDHIYAQSRGGSANLTNLQTLCRSCNSRKHAKILRRRQGGR